MPDTAQLIAGVTCCAGLLILAVLVAIAAHITRRPDNTRDTGT